MPNRRAANSERIVSRDLRDCEKKICLGAGHAAPHQAEFGRFPQPYPARIFFDQHERVKDSAKSPSSVALNLELRYKFDPAKAVGIAEDLATLGKSSLRITGVQLQHLQSVEHESL
jgi:hypothetical protein